MSLLHAYLSEDFERFSALVHSDREAAPRPTSSSSRPKNKTVDINAVDHLGRTVLHLAATEGKLRYVEILLSHHLIDVAKADQESGWTALHRALYNGRINVARAILSRSNLRSTSARDLLNVVDSESNTAFDVYNATVLGVNPAVHDSRRGSSDLFTFGSNANHTLGFADADDRAFPERVSIKQGRAQSDLPASELFRQHRILDVVMSKYHTLVITSETQDNIYSCGFAKNGRLGTTGGTQFSLARVAITDRIVAISAAQDHSLAVSSNGDLYSWGSGLHGQLGYDLENGATFSNEPKKISKLAKETIIGIAASPIHSVCFSDSSLWTWGLNEGQLGYEINAQEGRTISAPRKVTSLTAPVVQVTATRFATACLLQTDDVLIFTNYGYFKLSLQLDRFATQYQVFRPRQSYAPSKIIKIASGMATIVVMTNMGDVFGFILDESTAQSKPSALAKSIKPGRIWSLRKKHMAIRDIAVGQEGNVIMCTESGSVHLGVRRSGKQRSDSPKAEYKFSRVSGITRVVQVRANGYGAYGLIRDDVTVLPISLDATTLSEDLLCILPYSEAILEEVEEEARGVNEQSHSAEDDQESEQGESVPKHVSNACAMLRDPELHSYWTSDAETYDLVLRLQGVNLPCHKAICAARCAKLRELIVQGIQCSEILVSTAGDQMILEFSYKDVSLISLVIVVHWLYTDILLTPWIGCQGDAQTRMRHVREGVHRLARHLDLKSLAKATGSNYVQSPRATLAGSISALHDDPIYASLFDLRLMSNGGEILTHSVVLASRSEFFQAMLSAAWIGARRESTQGAIVDIDVKHISLEVMTIVLDHIFRDKDTSVFDTTVTKDLDEFLDLVVSVMAAATELILPRLKQSCEAVLRRYVHRKNVTIILHEADKYGAEELKTACMDYCAKNLQFLLENNFLADLDVTLVHELELYIARKQIERLPISKSGVYLSQLIQRNPSILEETEIHAKKYLDSLLLPMNTLKLSTDGPQSRKNKVVKQSKPETNHASPSLRPAATEDSSLIFEMEDYDLAELDRPSWQQPQTPYKSYPESTSVSQNVKSAEQVVQNPPVAGSLEQRRGSAKGWSSPSLVVPSVDLRETLELETKTEKPPTVFWSPPVQTKKSQRDRKKQSAPEPFESPSASNRESSSPWAARQSLPATSFAEISETQKSNVKPVTTSRVSIDTVPQSIRRPSAPHAASSFGPSSGSYSKSYVAPSFSPRSAQGGLSLAQIMQAEQSEKIKVEEYQAKRSMKEIQEQEEFERWFVQESIRIQKEEEASAALALRLSREAGAKGKRKQQEKNMNKQVKSRDAADASKPSSNRQKAAQPNGSEAQQTKSTKAEKPVSKASLHATASAFVPRG